MDHQAEVKRLKVLLEQSGHIQTELDRRIFHLKTLYDVSKDIFSSVGSEAILRNFLLMTMGTFGVTEGFILTGNSAFGGIRHFVSVGWPDMAVEQLKTHIGKLAADRAFSESPAKCTYLARPDGLPTSLAFVLPFEVAIDCPGLMGLGPKLIGEPYNENDRELLGTLVNNLVLALRNAKSFEQINRLNQNLEAKNKQLEETLNELKAALRKVEILESVKVNLCKFVPTAVTRIVEKSPTAAALEAEERDVSVLFLDIEGYTKITERIGASDVNRLVERYFSVFMDAIYENNGDVVETAGDGLMVLFTSPNKLKHALEAVKAAKTIKEKACLINRECCPDFQPLMINMGICSGEAFVGAARFESYTGCRWTYTSHGTTTNVAARLCKRAEGGAVLVSKTTADRVKKKFSFSPLGKFALKNLSAKVEVFALSD